MFRKLVSSPFSCSIDGPLLLAILKNGQIRYDNGRMSDQAIYDVTKRRAKQAGVKACSPHDFRRSFVTQLLRKDKDLLTVQRLAGHANPATSLTAEEPSACSNPFSTRERGFFMERTIGATALLRS